MRQASECASCLCHGESNNKPKAVVSMSAGRTVDKVNEYKHTEKKRAIPTTKSSPTGTPRTSAENDCENKDKKKGEATKKKKQRTLQLQERQVGSHATIDSHSSHGDARVKSHSFEHLVFVKSQYENAGLSKACDDEPLVTGSKSPRVGLSQCVDDPKSLSAQQLCCGLKVQND